MESGTSIKKQLYIMTEQLENQRFGLSDMNRNENVMIGINFTKESDALIEKSRKFSSAYILKKFALGLTKPIGTVPEY